MTVLCTLWSCTTRISFGRISPALPRCVAQAGNLSPSQRPATCTTRAGETEPGPQATSDADFGRYARAFGTTLYHRVGTCRMGKDPLAVADSRLRVHGTAGLRVIDTSIMPAITTGNPNALAIMIAEKGAAMILEDDR